MNELAAVRSPVLVLHATADEAFVCGFLVPALGTDESGGGVIETCDVVRVGVAELQNALTASAVTIVVLTSAFLGDPRSVVSEQLATQGGVERHVSGSACAGGVSAAFSPDGSRIVTGSADRTAMVWDAVTGRRESAVFSPDGESALTAGYGSVHTWSAGLDFRTLEAWRAIVVTSGSSWLGVTPDGLPTASQARG